jgi:hypothetical protein
VPVVAASTPTLSLRVRRQTDAAQHRSQPLMISHLNKAALANTTLLDGGGEESPFQLQMVPEAPVPALVPLTFHVHAPVFVENLLACDLDILVLSKEAAASDELKDQDVAGMVHLPCGGDTEITRLGANCQFAVRVAGHAWSVFHPVPALEGSKLVGPSQVIAPSTDAQTEDLRVNVDVTRQHRDACLRVSLSVPFWVFDVTSLDLQFSANKKTFAPRALHTPKNLDPELAADDVRNATMIGCASVKAAETAQTYLHSPFFAVPLSHSQLNDATNSLHLTHFRL